MTRAATKQQAIKGSLGTETYGGRNHPTEERWIPPKDFPFAQREVAWFFGSAESAMGAKGQAFEGGGGHVFDEDASVRLHEAMQTARHRIDVERYRRTWLTVRGLQKETRDLLAVAYMAHAWEHALRTAFESKRFGVTLVGVVLVGDIAAEEYAKHRAKHEKANTKRLQGYGGLIAWLAEEVRPHVVNGTETHRRPKSFDMMLADSEGRLQAALAVYDEARRARRDAEKRDAAERIARLVGDRR